MFCYLLCADSAGSGNLLIPHIDYNMFLLCLSEQIQQFLMFCRSDYTIHSMNRNTASDAGNHNMSKKAAVTGHNRIIYLDVLRIFAILGVMMIHISGHQWSRVGIDSPEWSVFNFYDSISRWAVPVFVMISGALFLSRHHSVRQIWSKNIPRLITAFLFWSAVYAAIGYDPERGAKGFLLDLIMGHYHMWFIYMIAGLYMIVPFLEKITRDRNLTRYFLLLGSLFTFIIPSVLQLLTVFEPGPAGHLNTILSQLGINLVAGYSVYYVMGYRLSRSRITSGVLTLAAIAGVTGAALTICLTSWLSHRAGAPYGSFFEYLNLNVALESICVFVLVKAIFTRFDLSDRAKHLITRLSDDCFGVFLVHPLILRILRKTFHLTELTFNPAVSVLLMLLITAAASFAISAVLNRIPYLKNYIV